MIKIISINNKIINNSMTIKRLIFAVICVCCLTQFAFAQEKELLNNGLLKVNNSGLFGLHDENGNVVVSAEYDDIIFYDGVAVLIKGDYAYGRVNDSGEKFFFEKPFLFNKKYPFYSEGYLVVGKQGLLDKEKIKWMYIDEFGNQLEMSKKHFSYAEPFFAGYAVVKDFVTIGPNEGVLRHIDITGAERFKMNANKIIHRSAVYWSGKESDRCECVIITDTGIHLCQEDGDVAVIKETLYRGNDAQMCEDPYSYITPDGGILFFNEKGQAYAYTLKEAPEEDSWLIPLP